MTASAHRRLRAPSEDAAALIEPAQSQFVELIARNLNHAVSRRASILGSAFPAFVVSARDEFLEVAIDYTRQERDTSWLPSLKPQLPFLLAGHQPELFHPGVWFKNFLLSSAAERSHGIGINLIVDTDTIRSSSVRVPVQGGSTAEIENVAFDAASDAVPFEERAILDTWLFESFAERLLAAYQTCNLKSGESDQPLIAEDIWKRACDVLRRGREGANLGLVLAQTRHWLEWRLGLRTLEIPLSTVAQTRHFRLFSAHLLVNLPSFSRLYNAALSEYRHINRIRSSTHPVPTLQEDDDWLEAPYYVWTTAEPQRRQLFVRQTRESMILTDRRGVKLVLDLSPDSLADNAIQKLSAAEALGIKLRPRALITTMYARLVLSDLFIHGMGGAKYDELTDLIIRRFFGIEPPAYVTATATFRLPIERPQVSIDDVQYSAHRIREIRYRPESFLNEPTIKKDGDVATKLIALAAEKRAHLDKHDLRRCSADVFHHLDSINRAMHDLLQPVEQELRARHAEIVALARQSQLLASREFSFVLFPAEKLSAQLLALSNTIS